MAVQFPIMFRPTKPISVDGNTYRRLSFNRPVGLVDIFLSEGIADPIEQMTVVTASLAHVPVEVITRMSVADQVRLAETVRPILALAPVAPVVA